MLTKRPLTFCDLRTQLGCKTPLKPRCGSARVGQFAWVGARIKNACWVGSGPSDPLRHVNPSAVQALGDWRKSLNWRTSAVAHPTVTTAMLKGLPPPTGCGGNLWVGAQGERADGVAPRNWAQRQRHRGVQSGRLPPCNGTPALALRPRGAAPAKACHPLLSFESTGGSTLETFNLCDGRRGCSGHASRRRAVRSRRG